MAHKHLDILKKAYTKFFKKQLEFFKVDSLQQLSSAGKRLLFEKIMKEWPAEKERIVAKEERRIKHNKELEEIEQKYGHDDEYDYGDSEDDYESDEYEDDSDEAEEDLEE